jgi:hypothetical protein
LKAKDPNDNFKPRVKRCSHCGEPKKDIDSNTFFCERFKWEIPKALGKRQALCDDRVTGTLDMANEKPALGDDEQ